MGCDFQAKQLYRFLDCFNSRTRMGCDQIARVCAGKQVVSIHAPAWGATNNHHLTPPTMSVSIHAPAWGATRFRQRTRESETFQFTHPHGVRPLYACATRFIAGFNSRTRMGCDRFAQRRMNAPASFNSRTRMGCDIRQPRTTNTEEGFQFTHPHGVRPMTIMSLKEFVKFQFTHPHGVRQTTLHLVITQLMFQFTHPHGVRLAATHLTHRQ